MSTLTLASEVHLNEAFADWKAAVTGELKGVPFAKALVTRTPEDIALQPLYTRADLAELPDLGSLPGAAPFLRGTRLGATTRGWEAAQEISFNSLTDFNVELRSSLLHGQDAVVLEPDYATQHGLDARETRARDHARGLALNTVEDFATALQEIDLAAVPVHLPAGPIAAPLAALYVAYTRSRGVDGTALTGSLTGDPFGAAAQTGMFPSELDAAFDAMSDWTRWASAHAPKVRTIGVDTGFWEDAGATASQQLAFAIATATDYLRGLLPRKVPVYFAASRIKFHFAQGPRFFTEIAKLRAFRPLWARILSGFGENAALARQAQVATRTARWNKTLLDPHVNLLRATTEALSGVLGGCDSLSIAAFDEPMGATTELSRRIARNLHTLLAEEFGFGLTADPAGGSWYVEKLTHELARQAWTQFQEIERHGGMAASLKSGYIQELVAKAKAVRSVAVATRRLPLIGTNLFPNLKEGLTPEAAANSTGVSHGTSHPLPRRAGAVRIERKAGEDPFAAALHAAQRGASLAQLYRYFEGSSATAITIPFVRADRAAAGFEALRASAAEFARRTGAPPKVFLAKIGPPAQHKARAEFTQGFFAVGGFEILGRQTFDSAAAAAEAAIASGARIAVLCSTDDTYPTLAPEFARAIRAKDAAFVIVLAGLPSDAAQIANYRAAGFDEFIHVRANLQEMLGYFLKQVGATL